MPENTRVPSKGRGRGFGRGRGKTNAGPTPGPGVPATPRQAPSFNAEPPRPGGFANAAGFECSDMLVKKIARASEAGSSRSSQSSWANKEGLTLAQRMAGSSGANATAKIKPAAPSNQLPPRNSASGYQASAYQGRDNGPTPSRAFFGQYPRENNPSVHDGPYQPRGASAGASAYPPGGSDAAKDLQLSVDLQKKMDMANGGELNSSGFGSGTQSPRGRDQSPVLQPLSGNQLHDYAMPRNTGLGTKGRRVQLASNFFSMKIPDNLTFYRYNVTMVSINNATKKRTPLTYGPHERYQAEQNRAKCFGIFMYLSSKCNQELGDRSPFKNRFLMAYDRRRTLYCVFKMNFGLPFPVTLTVDEPTDPNVTYEVKLEENKEEFIVNVSDMRLVVTSNLKDRNSNPLTVLDIIFNQTLYYNHWTDTRNDSFLPCGRSFFKRPVRDIVDLGKGRELWHGFSKHTRAVMGPRLGGPISVALNVDRTSTGFYAELELQVLVCEHLIGMSSEDNWRVLTEREIKTAVNYLKGHAVILSIPRKGAPPMKTIYTIKGLTLQPASAVSITENNQTSFMPDYYQKKYGYSMQIPVLPAVIVVSNKIKLNVPMELCRTAPKQRVRRGQLKDPAATSAMIQYTAISPEQRQESTEAMLREALTTTMVISDGRENATSKTIYDPYLKQLKIGRNDKMEGVTGRVLDHPMMTYQVNKDRDYSGKAVQVRSGVWDGTRGGGRFAFPAKIERWHVITFKSWTKKGPYRLDFNQMMGFIQSFSTLANQRGIQIPNCTVKNYRDKLWTDLDYHPGADFEEPYSVIETLVKYLECDLIVFLLPDDGGRRLKEVIKFLCESKYGMPSQCIKTQNARTLLNGGGDRKAARLGYNIMLKVNRKLGGVNFVVRREQFTKDFFDECMFIGADVTHPPPLSKKEQREGVVPTEPSLASIVASVDYYPSRFKTFNNPQDPRQEMIDEFERIGMALLTAHRQNTGKYPRRILYYRDGVSEGQYLQVLNVELEALQMACKALNINPAITLVIVTKRHHVRFYKNNIRPHMRGWEKNAEPGTVVDSMIVHPTDREFILASHQGIQGTSKPTKYVVLYDDNGMSTDDIQQLTFYLCHSYEICERSVSLPSPVYYAHLAAKKYKERLYGVVGGSDAFSTQNSETNFRFENKQQWKEAAKTSTDVGSSSFRVPGYFA